MKNDYDVTIKKLDYGYQVKVGCKTIAKENLKELLQDLKDYYEKPEKVYKKYGFKNENDGYVIFTGDTNPTTITLRPL